MKTEPKALTIYKASAGSGKTFTLSIEYIKLLIINPMSYRSTLAVTFTNKATEEMKSRILTQLYGIWKHLPDSHDYIEKISDDLKVSEAFMAERAGMALRNIVGNYSYFRIETIDSFFQSVLRNLARELDLTANLRIELNDYQIERNAVDELIDGLGENDELLGWIMEYIRENIDDDKNWNVIGQIKKFGENIFREFYKVNSKLLNKRLLEEGFFKAYTAKLRRMRDEAEADMKAEADKFFAILDENGVDIQDLSYGKGGAAGYFLKMRNGTYDDSIVTARARKAMDDGGADTWVKKTATDDLRQLAEASLSPMISHTEDVRRRCWRTYASAMLTLRHLNQLRLLNSIEKKVRQMNADANRFLLSDTHTLLHSLVKDTDTPFVFEKIGNYLENIMIDEFQDTSVVQWQNFKILLQECMSHGQQQGNLIVGDVKQSIYRWRSGDWRMLNNMEREFPSMQSMIKEDTLDTNYRSARRVIEFNNAFFRQAANLEYDDQKSCMAPAADADGDTEALQTLSAEQLKKAYSDVEQKVPEKRDNSGYVHISLLPQEDYQAKTLERTAEAVSLLLDSGASLSDIAIIVRSNSTIQLIADFFAKEMPEVKFVSDEAFRLDSSVAVNIIVSAMHDLAHPDDTLTKAYMAKAYQTQVLGKDEHETDIMLAGKDGAENALPAAYRDRRDELLAMPIFELAEKIYTIFDLGRISGEDAYVYAFYDNLTSYLTNKAADIDTFVDEWNDTICSKTIQAASIDGIRLITIHKSKGLEFEHVIIPSCDWRMEKGNTIWCSPQAAPFDELPLVPVDFNAKQMKGTIYEADYAEEHLQNCVDNLNLLYVAFTRAASSLFVIARRGTAAMRSYVIEKAIAKMALPGSTTVGKMDDKKAEIEFEYGELEVKEAKAKKKSDNIFTPQVDNIDITLETFDNNADFRQSNKSQEFVAAEDGDETERQQMDYIKTGRILHYLFSTINTTADIGPCLEQLERDGLTEQTGTSVESLRKMLDKRFKNKQVANWFSGQWTLFNECTILDYDPTTGHMREHRPDRVMKNDNEVVVVDFKFGSPRKEYAEQVRRYVGLIQSMGHDNVRGYLWYVYSNHIEEVGLH